MKNIITHQEKDLIPYLEFLGEENVHHQIHKTQYTTLVKVMEQDGFKEEKHLFTSSTMDKKTFLAYNMIKSDINESGFLVDTSVRNMVNYFEAGTYIRNMKHRKETYSDIVNIDLRSAYPTTLRNFGAISGYTYSYIHRKSFPKTSRLKAVGMLATQKVIYERKGRDHIQKPILKKDENMRNIFMAVCFEVGELMKQAVSIVGSQFLFYWVDGIYIKSTGINSKIEKVIQLFRDHGYHVSVDKLAWFSIERNEKNAVIEFEKENDIKPFIIPLNDIRQERKKYFDQIMNELKMNTNF